MPKLNWPFFKIILAVSSNIPITTNHYFQQIRNQPIQKGVEWNRGEQVQSRGNAVGNWNSYQDKDCLCLLMWQELLGLEFHFTMQVTILRSIPSRTIVECVGAVSVYWLLTVLLLRVLRKSLHYNCSDWKPQHQVNVVLAALGDICSQRLIRFCDQLKGLGYMHEINEIIWICVILFSIYLIQV